MKLGFIREAIPEVRLDLVGVAVLEVVGMEPCATCTDPDTRAFFLQHSLCPETCERMRRIRARLGLPVAGTPLTANADASAAAPRKHSSPVATSRPTALKDCNGLLWHPQRSEAMIPGSRR